MKRRDFIELGGKAFCACSLTSAGFFLNGCSEDNVLADTTGIELSFDLNEESFQALKINGGSVVTSSNELDPKGLLLYRENDLIKAYENRCTHANYDLLPFNDEGLSFCTGHGAQFNTDGFAITGPAAGNLKSFETLLEDDLLTIYGG